MLINDINVTVVVAIGLSRNLVQSSPTLLWCVVRDSYTCSECPSPGAPGGTTCLSVKLLEYLVALKNKYSDIYVSDLGGGGKE